MSRAALHGGADRRVQHVQDRRPYETAVVRNAWIGTSSVPHDSPCRGHHRACAVHMRPISRTAVLTIAAALINATLVGVASSQHVRPDLDARPAPPGGLRTTTPTDTAFEAEPGTVVRWSVMDGRSWAALQETCYYPIDLLRSPRVITMTRHSASGVNRSKVSIVSMSFPDEAITLGDIPQAAPSAADLRRDARDQAKVARLWHLPDRPAQFTLPLAAPASPLPAAQGFGSRYIFNGNRASSEIHNGADYALPAGTRVSASADGHVVLAEELFFAGNAVFIDHGDGLITMYFHLADITVRPGQDVRKGEAIGTVGETGRVTGPHLHFGVRWHGARINPALLLEDPAKIPAIAP